MSFFFLFGGGGGLVRHTQDYQIFRAARPHHRADKSITRKQNIHQFFIYGPNVKICAFLAIQGEGGGGGGLWPINNQTVPILLPSYPLTYINLHIKYGNNPIRIFSVIG